MSKVHKLHNLVRSIYPLYCTPCLKNVPHMVCYNFDTHEQILIFLGRNVKDKVGNQQVL